MGSAGGWLGGILGTMVAPILGTPLGAYAGDVAQDALAGDDDAPVGALGKSKTSDDGMLGESSQNTDTQSSGVTKKKVYGSLLGVGENAGALGASNKTDTIGG